MGNRLSKIYTRTGDAGTTGLGNGNRVSKNSLRIHSLGEVDELNAVIGLLLTEELPAEVRALLTDVQNDLFDLGGEVCIPGMSMISERQVTRLENELDRMNEELEPLKDFILPGGTRAAALAHMARTVCRRAERMLVGLAQEEAVNDGPR
jgi:cob(I)alamin adenosyltransferase